jgi:hypothetical protein
VNGTTIKELFLMANIIPRLEEFKSFVVKMYILLNYPYSVIEKRVRGDLNGLSASFPIADIFKY